MTIYFDMMIGGMLVSKARNVETNNMDNGIKEIEGRFKNNLVCNFTDQCPKKVIIKWQKKL